MKNGLVLLRAPLFSALLLLAACSEPQQPAQQAGAAAPAVPSANPAAADADAAFGAVLPAELTYDQRRESLLPAKECNLERANGAVFKGTPVQVASGSMLRLSGWVADVAGQAVPKDASVRLVKSDSRVWKVPVQPQLKRGDVQALLGGDEAYASAGYNVTVDTARLPAGNYRLYTVFPAQDGLRACDNGRALAIGP